MHRQFAPIALLLALVPAACGQSDDNADPKTTDAGASVDAGANTDASSAADSAAADSAADTAPANGPPYAVGVTTLTTIGANGRNLPTEVWYPIAAGSSGATARYLLGAVPSPYGALRDATALPGPFPLLAFSHGNGGVRDQSVFLTEAVARQGYVVVSPDHVGNTLTTMDNKLGGAISLWRPQDISAAIDRVLKPEAGDPAWLTGLVDGDKIAMTGHSFGGYTTLALAGLPVSLPTGVTVNCAAPDMAITCKELNKLGPPPWSFADPRIDLAIPLAHALYAIGALGKPTAKMPAIPIIIMAATGDTMTKAALEATPLFNDLPGQAALMLVQGGSHYSFANICEVQGFMTGEMKAAIGDICKADASPTMAAVHAAVVEHTLAALDIWLRGNDDARKVFDPNKSTGPVYSLKSKGIYPANKGN